MPGDEAGGNLLLARLAVVGIGVHHGSQGVRGRLLVVDFGGNGVDGVDLHGHGQLAQVAIIEHAASRSYLEGALLLLLRSPQKLVVAHHLEPEEAKNDDTGPHQKKEADQPEARPLEGHDVRDAGAIAVGSNGCLHDEFSS